MGTPARQLAAAVALIALGAVLMLAAAGREWIPAAEPGPLPSQAAGRSGADLLPWLPAAGWVALAGAGAMVAVRAWPRRLLGGALAVTGAAVVLGCGWAVFGAGAGWGWPLAAGAGGGLMVAAAAVSVWRAAVWPALGARYERRPATAASGATARRPDLLWDALDRGEDPTA